MPVIRTVVRLTAKGFILCGLGVFGYQAVMGFLSGHWMDLDVLWLVYWLFSSQGGLDLHGVTRWILDFLPLSLSLVVVGSFLLAAIYRGEKERRRIIDDVEKEMRARQDRARL